MLPDGLIAPIVGLASAVAGYLFREWQNRATPLFEVIQIHNTTTGKPAEKVQIPQSIRDELKGAVCMGELQPLSSLKEVYETWDACDDLVRSWPETKEAIEKVISAKIHEEYLQAIEGALQLGMFDVWLWRLLIDGKLNFQDDETDSYEPDVKIPFWFEDEKEGTLWFGLPSGPVSFGHMMSHPMVKGKCMSFVKALSELRWGVISREFAKYLKIFDADEHRARGCIHELTKINDENSQWSFCCYLANTGNLPIVVEKSAALIAVDKRTRTTHQQSCYLCSCDEDLSVSDAPTPLIVPAGEGRLLAFLTTERQKDMELGSALLELFGRGDGECRLSVILRRSGLRKRQEYSTAATAFVADPGVK